MKKITCIIPAYNEALHIAHIVQIVSRHPLIHEVIVVDDGSDDGTLEIVRGFHGIHLISLHENHWKSSAVQAGLKQANTEYIMLLDADLEGLRESDISELISPIWDDHASMTISLRKDTPLIWRLFGIDYTSGERVFKRSLIDQETLSQLWHMPRFGLEVFLNALIIKNHQSIQVVPWPQISRTPKWTKRWFVRGTISDFFMRLDIYRTMGFTHMVSQIRDIQRLIVTQVGGWNWGYFQLYKEMPLFLLLPFHKSLFYTTTPVIQSHAAVLVALDMPVIAEFIASVPAIARYIQNHPDIRVDVIVAPVTFPLAQKIRSIGNVYTVSSFMMQELAHASIYEDIYALRIHEGSYQALLRAQTTRLHTGVKNFITYWFHLIWALCMRKTPNQWRDIHFQIMGEQVCSLWFDDIFQFHNDRESEKVLASDAVKTTKYL